MLEVVHRVERRAAVDGDASLDQAAAHVGVQRRPLDTELAGRLGGADVPDHPTNLPH